MLRRLADGIIWVGIGASLVVQGTFLVVAVFEGGSRGRPADRALALGEAGIVATGMLLVGCAALYWGLRRLAASVAQADPPAPSEGI